MQPKKLTYESTEASVMIEALKETVRDLRKENDWLKKRIEIQNGQLHASKI